VYIPILRGEEPRREGSGGGDRRNGTGPFGQWVKTFFWKSKSAGKSTVGKEDLYVRDRYGGGGGERGGRTKPIERGQCSSNKQKKGLEEGNCFIFGGSQKKHRNRFVCDCTYNGKNTVDSVREGKGRVS